MEKKKTKQVFKPYEELEFRDDFMFGHVLRNKELCHDFLECLLQRKVGELKEVSTQEEFRYTEDGKPVRLDVYTEDENRVYDGEMHNKNNKSIESMALPKRTRFYQSSLDADHMNKGSLYKDLPESVILFICTFDLFGKGLAKYSFKERCEEDDSLYLNDGTEKVFYNCTYRGKDISDDLKKLYKYIETGKATDELTERIDREVMEARKIAIWRSDYMHVKANMMDAREEGREEGELKHIISLICKKIQKGKDIRTIAEELEEDDDIFVSRISEIAAKYAPDYDTDKIYEEYIDDETEK